MMRLTLPTAFRTPLPPYRALSPSRSSSASRSPVDAPDGTAARPNAPSASETSTSTVGLPRESRISRPCTFVIFKRPPKIQEPPRNPRNVFFSCFSWGWFRLSASTPPIRLSLEPQRLVADRSNQRLVVDRHDDDA